MIPHYISTARPIFPVVSSPGAFSMKSAQKAYPRQRVRFLCLGTEFPSAAAATVSAAIAAAAAAVAAATAAPAIAAAAAAEEDDDQDDDPQAAAAAPSVIATTHYRYLLHDVGNRASGPIPIVCRRREVVRALHRYNRRVLTIPRAFWAASRVTVPRSTSRSSRVALCPFSG